MYHKLLALIALPLVAGLLTSCAGTTSDTYVIESDPGTVQHVEGSEIARVTLTPAAVKRLRIETTPVVRAGGRLTVPDTAIFVDPDGVWWVYTNPQPRVYVRHEVALEEQRDGRAMFRSGPGPGTEVVTVGVAELSGIEAEVGH